MNRYIIKINNKYYMGDSEELYNSQDYNKSGWNIQESYISKIKLCNNIKDAHIINYELNLKYPIEKILMLQKYNLLKFNEIKIIKL